MCMISFKNIHNFDFNFLLNISAIFRSVYILRGEVAQLVNKIKKNKKSSLFMSINLSG